MMPDDKAQPTRTHAPHDPAPRAHSRARRGSVRLLSLAVAVVLAGKLALVVLSYVDALSGALAIAADVRTKPPQVATANVPDAPTDGRARLGSPQRPPGIAPEAAAPRPADAGGKPAEVRALVEAITRRQGELQERERELAAREERLRVYEQDVIAKIASLEEIEKRLQVRAKAATAAVDAAAESLAKVYAAMKPGDAATILERLDEPTVLTIFGRMKEKQIGEILPLMSKEKAIALTQALASTPLR